MRGDEVGLGLGVYEWSGVCGAYGSFSQVQENSSL